MDIRAQYLKYKKKYQRIKASQKGGNITNELKMNEEIQKVNDQYNAYFIGSSGYGEEEIKAAQRYDIEKIKEKYSHKQKSPVSVTRQSPLKSSLNQSDALKEIHAMIKKDVNFDAVTHTPQDAYDRGFVSAQLIYLTGNNPISFEDDRELNAHYIAGFEDGETAGEIRERGSDKYIHIYRDNYVLPTGPITPQSDIIVQSPPITLPRVATDRIKQIEAKYTGTSGLLSGTHGQGTDTLINQMDDEISQVIQEYTLKK